MKKQHTLGPWVKKQNSNGGFYVASVHAAKNDADVTDTYRDQVHMSEADADLCAAAPDMLQALKDFYLHAVLQNWSEDHAPMKGAMEIINKIEGI